MPQINDEIGIVIIGRNEGERLNKCIASTIVQSDKIVYVDSGSSDDSVFYSNSIGIKCIELDPAIPFSAGRARNEGFQYIIHKFSAIKYIQFIDGDCELESEWLATGVEFLNENNKYAIVAGNVKEKNPGKTVYNLICDIEWNSALGETDSCGGIFIARKSAFEEIGGFNPNLIAGEEPEMCYRLRKKNWAIYRLDCPMVIHDAAMAKFTQWWKRCIRTGHAYAHAYNLHRKDDPGYSFSRLARSWFWALLFPASLLFLSLFYSKLFLYGFSVYILQVANIAITINKKIYDFKSSIIYGFFTVLAKWPQLIGQLNYIIKRYNHSRFTIIEYK